MGFLRMLKFSGMFTFFFLGFGSLFDTWPNHSNDVPASSSKLVHCFLKDEHYLVGLIAKPLLQEPKGPLKSWLCSGPLLRI